MTRLLLVLAAACGSAADAHRTIDDGTLHVSFDGDRVVRVETGVWRIELVDEEPTSAKRTPSDPRCPYVGGLARIIEVAHTDLRGRFDGHAIDWTQDHGLKVREGDYARGERHGTATYYDTCGNRAFDLGFEHDHLVSIGGVPIRR